MRFTIATSFLLQVGLLVIITFAGADARPIAFLDQPAPELTARLSTSVKHLQRNLGAVRENFIRDVYNYIGNRAPRYVQVFSSQFISVISWGDKGANDRMSYRREDVFLARREEGSTVISVRGALELPILPRALEPI